MGISFTRRTIAGLAIAGAAAAATGIVGATTASAETPAYVTASPNPVLVGEQILITGSCNGGTYLRAIHGDALDNVIIQDSNPYHFAATSVLRRDTPEGQHAIFVDCGETKGMTTLNAYR